MLFDIESRSHADSIRRLKLNHYLDCNTNESIESNPAHLFPCRVFQIYDQQAGK